MTLGLFMGIPVSIVHTETKDRYTSSPSERRHDVKRRFSLKTSKTDLARVRKSRDKDIALSAEHPEADVRHIVRGNVRRGLKPVSAKASISLRVDVEILEWFRAQGLGYQTKMNAVLRAFKDASV